ncbi:hypothetical protein CCACVL1_29100, partial [Corchorus capsularis]
SITSFPIDDCFSSDLYNNCVATPYASSSNSNKRQVRTPYAYADGSTFEDLKEGLKKAMEDLVRPSTIVLYRPLGGVIRVIFRLTA